MDISSVCVYCGSSTGTDPAYAVAARRLGELLAGQGITVVTGAGGIGLMGQVADGALASGGKVIGVIPRGLFGREVPHRGLTELIEVGSMHERKQLMFELSDGFVALPGGLGTLEELAEMSTWVQLGIHAKPIVTLDVSGYWSPLRRFVDQAVARGFMKARNRDLVSFVTEVDAVLPALRAGRGEPAGEPGPGPIP